jgi:hypothetical protein
MRGFKRSVLSTTLLTIAFLTFQNCGKGFASLSHGSLSQGSEAAPPTPELQPPAPVPPAPHQASPLPLSSSGQLIIPNDGWLAQWLPELGTGPCPRWTGGCKHIHMAVNPLNQKVYLTAGDYEGSSHDDSYRNETYSYDITTDVWKLEYPYCGPTGDFQPDRPDETVWTWDSKRQVFWSLPGYWESYSAGKPCGGAGATNYWGVMQFNPATGKWAKGPAHYNANGSERGKFGQYDPITDTITTFRHGFNVDVLHLSDGHWDNFSVGRATGGEFTSNSYLVSEGNAIDVEARAIYIMEPYTGILYRYNIDQKTLTVVAQAPELPGDAQHREDFTQLAFDAKNKVLYYMRLSGGPDMPDFPDAIGHAGYPTIWVFNPATKIWHKAPTSDANGERIRGNTIAFHEGQNALMVFGGASYEGANGEPIGRVGKFFFYRYQ